MAQGFFINKNATLPSIKMEVINDGRYDFSKLWIALQSADVKFTMWDKDNGIKKIANAPAYVVEKENESCVEEFIIEYRWKERDTKDAGRYIGQFTIDLKTDVINEGKLLPKGKLLVPISEELEIVIKDGSIKK